MTIGGHFIGQVKKSTLPLKIGCCILFNTISHRQTCTVKYIPTSSSGENWDFELSVHNSKACYWHSLRSC